LSLEELELSAGTKKLATTGYRVLHRGKLYRSTIQPIAQAATVQRAAQYLLHGQCCDAQPTEYMLWSRGLLYMYSRD
jgi:hypothetical protein